MTNVPVHSSTSIPLVGVWFSESSLLSQLFSYVFYPMAAVSFCAAIYMTLAVTVERYIAVCRPHQYRSVREGENYGIYQTITCY